jgi:hypothetical protein
MDKLNNKFYNPQGSVDYTHNHDTEYEPITTQWVPYSYIPQNIGASSGYQKIGNIIIQWGTATILASTWTIGVSYNITFPNNVQSVVVGEKTITGPSNWNGVFVLSSGFSNSGFTASRANFVVIPLAGYYIDCQFYYVAIGY